MLFILKFWKDNICSILILKYLILFTIKISLLYIIFPMSCTPIKKKTNEQKINKNILIFFPEVYIANNGLMCHFSGELSFLLESQCSDMNE